MAKSLESYKKLYRQKYPNLSDKQITDLAKAAMAKDSQNTSANDAPPSFGDTTVDTGASKRGVIVGFGLTDKDGNDLYVMPGTFPQFMTNLSVRNPKAYNTILTNVFKATGTKYRDPNTLGTWMEGVGKNLLASARQDPTAASISMEALVNANIVNRGAAGIFGDGGKENLPTRQIYDVPKAKIEADVDETAQKILGRTINDEDKQQDWYQDLVSGINKLYQKGTLTTSKKVVNPATGKKEVQVIQKPGFSQEKIASTIEQTLTEASPVDVERKQRVDFTQWLFSQLGGQR
jgi:hypothetical protein